MGLCVPRIETLCDLLAIGNTAGWFFLLCEEIEFIPAECPEELDPEAPAYLEKGVIKIGPVTLKVASVGAMADLMVQRDSDAVAYAERWEVETSPCAKNGSRIEQWNAHVGSPLGADDPGPDIIASSLRLRGHGDLAIYGGDQAVTNYGVGKIYREGAQRGLTALQNIACETSPGSGVVNAFHFFATDAPTSTDMPLMSLDGLLGGPPSAFGTLFAPSWFYACDEKTKSNIEPVDCDACLDAIRAVSPINCEIGGNPYTCFSAQNLQVAIPNCVSERAIPTPASDGIASEKASNTLLTVRDMDIIAHAVGAIKALDAQVQELRAELAALKGA